MSSAPGMRESEFHMQILDYLFSPWLVTLMKSQSLQKFPRMPLTLLTLASVTDISPSSFTSISTSLTNSL